MGPNMAEDIPGLQTGTFEYDLVTLAEKGPCQAFLGSDCCCFQWVNFVDVRLSSVILPGCLLEWSEWLRVRGSGQAVD